MHPTLRPQRAAAVVVVSLVTTLATGVAFASRTRVHALEAPSDFADGTFDGTSLTDDGAVVLGPSLTPFVSVIGGPVLALATTADGAVYAGTSSPARVFRMFKDRAPELVVELKAALVTALVPLDGSTLVAFTSADAAAHFIALRATGAGEVKRTVAAPDVKFLLGAVKDGDTLYVVGGGEGGALLELAKGATAFTTLGTVKEKTLRSVARAPFAGRKGLVVGGGDDGLVYVYDGRALRSLVDAEPTEVSSLVVDTKGRTFAALVDAQGKVTDGATARDAAAPPADDKEASKAKPKEKKARKVKSAEVLRIDPDGSVHVLWQSKKHGAYALLLDKRGLLVGTGGDGQVLLLDPEGRRGATVLGSAKDADEIVALTTSKAGDVLLGTAHGGGVVELSAARRSKGQFTSGVVDAKQVARYGHLDFAGAVPDGAKVTLEVRTGGNAEPDDTWSAWSPSLASAGVPVVPAARYAQVRATLEAKGNVDVALGFVRLAYLTSNRPPEIAELEVVAPGWKVRHAERERSDARSVTFGKGAFKKFAQPRGSSAPVLDERPSGKQSFDAGHRTVYAFVEDPDGDALRYRFSLAKVSPRGDTGPYAVVKEWSEEPFVSLDMARLKDGAYRVRVETDDMPTNGPARALGDARESPTFDVAHQPPRFASARATPGPSSVRVVLDVEALAPLTLVACSAGGADWVPVDPSDGILDTAKERFDTTLPLPTTEAALRAASCLARDEAGNEARTDLAW